MKISNVSPKGLEVSGVVVSRISVRAVSRIQLTMRPDYRCQARPSDRVIAVMHPVRQARTSPRAAARLRREKLSGPAEPDSQERLSPAAVQPDVQGTRHALCRPRPGRQPGGVQPVPAGYQAAELVPADGVGAGQMMHARRA